VTLLATYLNDHLAGATAGRELARRTASSNRRDERFAAPARQLAEEVEEDRESLLAIMRTLGVGEDRLKVAAGWTAEKLGRLKPNGRLFSYSPLSRLIELEGLTLGVRGKLAMWESLLAVAREEPRLQQPELERLATRARAQLETLERLRLEAASEALLG
jgi:hypothetical protein